MIVVLFALSFATAQETYSMYLMAVDWKPGMCVQKPCGNGFISEDFNIHGLWPSYSMGFGPQNCPGDSFSLLADTKQLLEVYWRSYSGSLVPYYEAGSNEWFWRHEWEKHGTCVYPQMKPDEYFRSVVALFKEINVKGRLQEVGIEAGREAYPIAQFRSAFPVAFKLTCGHSHVLETIKFCLDLSFALIDCRHVEESNCGDTAVLLSM